MSSYAQQKYLTNFGKLTKYIISKNFILTDKNVIKNEKSPKNNPKLGRQNFQTCRRLI